jgi:putative DNA primase/helicase
LKSVEELSRVKVSIDNEHWDCQKDYLPCKNGLLHIPSRTLVEHNPDYYFSAGIGFDYDPYADCPNFKYVLSTTIPEEEAFLQEFAGYCLTTDSSHETAVWLYGPPGSGKSTILLGICAMLGPRAGYIGLTDIEKNSFSLQEIPGKTLLASFEQPGNKHLATETINRIISGEPVTVNRKHKKTITITPKAKLMWAMNELPVITSANNGLLRRVKVIKFPPLPEDKKDITLKEKVAKEGPGILNWALDGLQRLNERGYFKPPQAVLDATNNFKAHVDIPALFLQEKCKVKHRICSRCI